MEVVNLIDTNRYSSKKDQDKKVAKKNDPELARNV